MPLNLRTIRRDALQSALTTLRDYLQIPDDGSPEHRLLGEVFSRQVTICCKQWEQAVNDGGDLK